MIKKPFSYKALLAGLLMTGCTDLDVDVLSDITPDNFPKTEEQLKAASGAIYTAFASQYGGSWWLTSEISGDAAILPANGGNWYDGGIYMQCTLHSWTPLTGGRPGGQWAWLYSTINTCNSVYELLAAAADSEAKETAIAELRVMRALCYFYLMDIYGGAPLVTKFGDAVKTRNSRQELFDFVEKEVTESAPLLNPENDITTYGRPNQMTAYTLLAKLYLNAEVYTGTPMWNEALQMCDRVMAFEADNAVELHADYLDMFNYDNGPRIKEFIFAIPYDENNLRGFTPSRFFLGRYTLQALGGYQFGASSCLRVIPAFYDLFTEDPNDVREKTFMKEQLYAEDGVTPLTFAGNRLSHPKAITFVNESTFDVGDTDADFYKGYRSNKFTVSKSQPTNNHSNDLPVFRYADVLLMKAEAILRGAAPTNGDTPVSLVNRVRERSGCAPWTSVDLNRLLDERGRELCYEAWRRNDLIRFGKYEDDFMAFNTIRKNTDPAYRLFPIPQTEIDKNPELTQNPGY
jgi:SusD family.